MICWPNAAARREVLGIELLPNTRRRGDIVIARIAKLERQAIVVLCFSLLSTAGCSRPSRSISRASEQPAGRTQLTVDSWNKKAAAAYLDGREDWWMHWKGAARDQSTFCVSCHTSVPYLLARPKLRAALEERGPCEDEQELIQDVTTRVRNWKMVQAYYRNSTSHPQQSKQSRGTESVLNAFILSSRDAETGSLGDDTRLALEAMWGEQQATGEDRGSWPWQQFALEPWESKASEYYGATLAIAAVGMAPAQYRTSPEIQGRLMLLQNYLSREYADQSLYNRLALLWAATKFPGLVDPDLQARIVNQTFGKQHSDGGWSFSSLVTIHGWNRAAVLWTFNRRRDGTPQETASDGLATGMIVSTFLQLGAGRNDPRLEKGIDWLIKNQNARDGSWTAYSLNQKRDPDSNAGRFMSDAATAYAVLALSEARIRPGTRGGF